LPSLRILVVDDHQAVRRGLCSLLSSRTDWMVCGEAVDGLDAVEKARTLRPHVVLMDVSMPRMNGIDAAQIIRRELPESRIVIVSQNDPSIISRQLREVDAAAYVAKSDLPQLLLPTLDRLVGHLDAQYAPALVPAGTGRLAGGGSLGQLIREHDWSRSPLGPIESWPQSLKTSVSLMLNSRHPMWIGWGPEMTFLYNDAYVSVLSLAKHPESLGRPAREVWPEIWDICGPLADKVFEKGEATFIDDVRFFMNRGEFLEETYYSFSYSPIHDESGKIAGLFCPSTETTPKILNARRLRTLSELAAKALVEKSTDAACASSFSTLAKNPDDIPFALLYLMDSDGRHALLEQSAGVCEGLDRISPSQVDLDDSAVESQFWRMNEVLSAGQAQTVSLEKIDGVPLGPARQRVSQAIVLPVTSRAQDRPIGVLIAGINPTRKLDSEYQTFYELIAGQVATVILNARAAEEERKRAEALAEIDRAKTVFFNNVSHEFRTPLALMLGPVEDLLAKSHTDLSPAAKNQLELVNRNGSRLLRLVNTLLDFSRIEAGRMQVVYEPTDLSAFTVELASVFRSATEKAGLELRLDCPRLGEPAFVDRDMWEKIVLNLISNAFKFTLTGEIAVSLAHVGNTAELRVRDTGVGIPAKELPRLFDRFHRVPDTRSRTHEGSGIGLALVQELVKLHGGSVRVESVLGEGSTFIVSIPLGSAHLPVDRLGGSRSLTSTAVGAAPFVEEALGWLPGAEFSEPQGQVPSGFELLAVPCPPVSQQESASSGRPRVLIADDNADMRRYLVRLLAERYDVTSVPDGQAALDAVRERPPDLILTDVMMPQLDGFGLLRELRSNVKTSTIPIILLSARAGEESRVEGIERGADDYLIKPFSARELLARVQTHLELARVRKQNEDTLRQSTAQFETLLNEAPLGVYVVDGDFRIRQINPPAVAAFGNIPDLIGRDFDEVIHVLWPKEYADEIVERFRHTLETGEPYMVPERIENRADRGVREIYEWQINRIPLADRRYGVVCYFRDISAQVGAREALRESQDRLRHLAAIVDSSEDAIVSKNLDGIITSWNRTAEQSFGYTAEEAIGRHISLIVPPEQQREEALILEQLRRGERVEHFETVRVRKDGTRLDLSLTISPVKDAEGRVIGASKVARDIAERRRADDALRKMTAEAVAATAKFQAVFEQTPVFAGIMAIDGTITAANRLCLEACGYHADEVVGRLFWETPWWRGSQEVQAKIRAAAIQAAQGIPYRETLTYHWADDTQHMVDFALHPIRDHQGQILFLHPTGVDITDLKRAEENYRMLAETLEEQVQTRTEELEQRTREVLKQSEQLREVSHRLMRIQEDERRHIARELHDSAGQILAALGMNLSSMVQQARRNAPELAQEVEEAQQLVQELNQEIRTTSYLLHPPLLDESGLSEALLWYIRGLQERSGLEITLAIPEDFGRLSHEMELVIFRIVQESLTNVHRHSGSKVASIRIACRGQIVSLEVQDQGRGMSPEKLAEIQTQGAGVGIRGMRERVLQLGGEVRIQSRDTGTTILVTLPTAAAKPAEYTSSIQAAG
jgi:PAS domain S-box-containing protein